MTSQAARPVGGQLGSSPGGRSQYTPVHHVILERSEASQLCLRGHRSRLVNNDHEVHCTSTTALITPDSGFAYDSNTPAMSSNPVRCVIHGRVSIRSVSISSM